MHRPLLDDFRAVRATLEREAATLREDVARLLEGATPSLKVHSVSLRLKSEPSLAAKLARPDRSYGSLWSITDLVGVRVIVYFEDDVDRVGQLLEGHLTVDYTHSIDKRRSDATTFGYRSLHYVCRFLGDPLALPPEACFEVQVRTVLEHAWAEIEHDLGYKSETMLPFPVQRRLHRLAGLLELADQEFAAIRNDLLDYEHRLPQRIAADGESVLLDHLSLEALVDCEEVRAVDEAIAQTLGRTLGGATFFPDYLVRMLASSGVVSAGDARRKVTLHAPAIVAMVKPYFAFAWQAWKLTPEPMPAMYRGYALFFLAHAEVLRSPALGLDKVERLTRLYRELDYPDDAQEARRVAILLVDAFGDLGVVPVA